MKTTSSDESGGANPGLVGTALDADAITDRQLEALFAAHCECRPLDIDRTADEHSHDCDTKILDDIQAAFKFNAADDQEQHAARFRCAAQWNDSLASAIYATRLAAALEHPPMTIQEWNRCQVTPETLTWNQLVDARFGPDSYIAAHARRAMQSAIDRDRQGFDVALRALCVAINARRGQP